MCGIAGELRLDGAPADRRAVEAMAAALARRGPDGHGVFVDTPVALGHRRLAVIDPSAAGHQPMVSGRLALTFNGEIYNHRELRQELGDRYPFRTRTDTEVILALYAVLGVTGLDRLDGMFAFGLWDGYERRLVLARDRLGKKPLLLYRDPRRLVFGSELSAFLARGDLDLREQPQAMERYLSFGYVPSPQTFFARVERHPPSTTTVVQQSSSTAHHYWRHAFADLRQEPFDDASPRRILRLFDDAVAKRLEADVPLGAFLSGGLDSSLVVAAMAQAAPGRVRTFSVGFDDEAFDESAAARETARLLGTEHQELRVTAAQAPGPEEVLSVTGEPFADPSMIPSLQICRRAREEVTVVLTGDGGDELFVGYPRMLMASGLPVLSRLRGLGRRLAPAGGPHRSLRGRVGRLVERVAMEPTERLHDMVSIFRFGELSELLGRPPADPLERYRQVEAGLEERDRLNRILFLNYRTYLEDQLNVKLDLTSMAASLEARSPFLDHALVHYVSALPGGVKIRGLRTKHLLREVFADRIPAHLRRRPKMGFGPPLGRWMRSGLKGRWMDLLSTPAASVRQRLDGRALDRILDAHARGVRDWSLQIWTLVLLELFLRARRSGA